MTDFMYYLLGIITGALFTITYALTRVQRKDEDDDNEDN